MSINLQYNYAVIDINTGMCGASITSSAQVNHLAYIEIPWADPDYVDKYYNLNGDQMWYWDAGFTQLWEECPSHNV